MSVESRSLALLVAAVLLPAAGAGPLDAQLQSGNVHGVVRSDEADLLPGVTVELSGPGATLTRTTDRQGLFRFLALAPGTYRVAATLEGFSPVVHERVIVAVGRNTVLEVTLMPAIEETVTVTAESPALDERKISAGAIVTRTELERVPSARDPWVVLQTVPGVLTTDVNVGGNKSGMQQGFSGSGSLLSANTYALDGVVISDAWNNSSATYYDFEAFEQIEVSTGGSDASAMGDGVTLNMVTRRAANDWRVSARYLVANDAWQDDLAPDPGSLGEGQEQFTQGDRIVKIEEYGVEGGGPLVHDRLWAWGFVGRNDIGRLTIADVQELTELHNHGLKINAQPAASSSAVAFFHYGNKAVDGRGAGPTRPRPTTLDQDGPTSIYKLENNQILGPRLFLTGFLAAVEGGFSLTPKGGSDGPNAVLDESFVWRNNFYRFDTDRDRRQARIDGSRFFSTGRLEHELHFGADYRLAESRQIFAWPGDVVRNDFYLGAGYPHNVAEVNRREASAFTTRYTSLLAQDTLRSGRLTINLGLRFDRQQGQFDSASVPGVPGFETLPDGTPLMPAVSVDGGDQELTWEDLVHRLGLTWALGPRRDTLVRASLSRFSTPMDQQHLFGEWPIGRSVAGFFYRDANGDARVTVDEIIDFEDGPLYTNGYDPLAREGLDDIDPGFEAPLSDELILGVERALLPELVLGLSATWRNQRRVEESERLVIENGVERPHLRTDYELRYVRTVTLPDGSTSDVPVYGLREGIGDTGRGLLTNGRRETDYLGLNLTLTKRLSTRWMLRGHLSWSEWTWNVPESEREDPNIRHGVEGRDDDGGPVYPGWSYRLGGLVRIAPVRGWGFDLGGNLWGRQGYAIDYFTSELGVFETESRLELQAVRPLDDFRLPDVHLLDLRLEKELRSGDLGLSLAVECFNVLNRSTVLRRENRLDSPTRDWVREVVNPRVFRLSTRLRFR